MGTLTTDRFSLELEILTLSVTKLEDICFFNPRKGCVCRIILYSPSHHKKAHLEIRLQIHDNTHRQLLVNMYSRKGF